MAAKRRPPMTERADRASDRRANIKEGTGRDTRKDTRMGVKQPKKGGK